MDVGVGVGVEQDSDDNNNNNITLVPQWLPPISVEQDLVDITEKLFIPNIFKTGVDVAFTITDSLRNLSLFTNFTCLGTIVSQNFNTSKAKTILKELVRFPYVVREFGFSVDPKMFSMDNILLTGQGNINFKKVLGKSWNRQDSRSTDADFKALSESILIDIYKNVLYTPWDVKLLLEMLKTQSTYESKKSFVYNHYAFMEDSQKINFLVMPYYIWQDGTRDGLDMSKVTVDVFGDELAWVPHVTSSLSGSHLDLVYQGLRRNSFGEGEIHTE